jgi:hypothetical protein
MNYYFKLIISLFLLFTITFTGVAKSATAMTLNHPTTHLGCVFLCEEHHDNTYDKGNGDIWAFVAGIFAGMAAAFTFLESVSHPSIIK